MLAARRNPGGIGQAGRNVALALPVSTPGRHAAIGFKRQTMSPSASNGRYPGQFDRHIALVLRIVAPGDYRGVALERQAMVFSGGYSYHIAQSFGHHRLAGKSSFGIGVFTPSHDRSVGFQSQTMITARSDRHQIAQT